MASHVAVQALLAEIDAFLHQHPYLKETTFGAYAVHDGRFVGRLRRGGRTWPETEAKVRKFMAEYSGPRKPGPKPKATASARAGHAPDNAGQMVDRLADLLRRADAVIVWESEPHLGFAFQTEVEAALDAAHRWLPETPSPSPGAYQRAVFDAVDEVDATEPASMAAMVRRAEAEIDRLRLLFRVNMLRLAPEASHAEIDDILEGRQ